MNVKQAIGGLDSILDKKDHNSTVRSYVQRIEHYIEQCANDTKSEESMLMVILSCLAKSREEFSQNALNYAKLSESALRNKKKADMLERQLKELKGVGAENTSFVLSDESEECEEASLARRLHQRLYQTNQALSELHLGLCRILERQDQSDAKDKSAQACASCSKYREMLERSRASLRQSATETQELYTSLCNTSMELKQTYNKLPHSHQ